MGQNEINQKLLLLGQAFSPSAPIIARDLFFGRQNELQKVVDGINERGQHIVLYGERGVGKTSLANIINFSLLNVITAKAICNRNDSFKMLWEKLLKRVSITQSKEGPGFKAEKVTESYQLNIFLSPEKDPDINGLVSILSKIEQPVLFILDEFDSISDKQTKSMFADSIKAFSDDAPHVTVAMVGIADSVMELIGEHDSIERCLKQIKIPRMDDDELGEIIDNGLNVLKLNVEPEIRANIIKFSSGYPHYTHLLSKFAAKSVIEEENSLIEKRHFDAAVSEAIDNAQESVRSAYQKAVFTTKSDTIFEDVLSACAIVKTDEHNTFRATDLIEPIKQITGKDYKVNSFTYHLGKLCGDERKNVLLKFTSSKMSRFKIRNPILRAFIMLRLYQSNLDGRQIEIF